MKKKELKSLKLNKTSVSDLKGGLNTGLTTTIVITRNSCMFSCNGSCNSCNSCDGCQTFDTTILINPTYSI